MWSVRSVQVASSAQYIVEQFRATTGCARLGDGAGAVRSMYASGRVRLAMLQDPTGGGGGGGARGELRVLAADPPHVARRDVRGRQHVATGSEGRVAWRRTPWLGAHAARGGSRPLRRALQVGMPLLPIHHPRWHCAAS
jgi:hypothetical protein